MENNREPKTDNGWFHIDDVKPNSEEEVLVVLEHTDCVVDYYICKAVYHTYIGQPKHFSVEAKDGSSKVRYWRRIEVYPYPDDLVKKEIEECKKYNVNYRKILEHQQKCGIDISKYQ